MPVPPERFSDPQFTYRHRAQLQRWLTEIPLYQKHRTLFENVQNAVSDLQTDLNRLPFTTKEDIRRGFPHNFLRPGQELEALLEQDFVELEHTSGTSEEQADLLMPKGWWAEQELRALRLNSFVAGVFEDFPEARRVTISSPVCSGEIRYVGVPSRLDRVVGNSLFTNLSRFPFLWSAADLDRMVAETSEWSPQFLDVDPVYGVVFALHCERRGVRFPSLRFVLCTYEFLSVVHRAILERVFCVPVLDLYGSTETGHLLMETENARMLASRETAFLETVSADEKGIGRLVVTTLTNDSMPLIRYQIGDLVERYGSNTYLVHGREADAVLGANGRRVTVRELDQCFAGVSGFAHYQLREIETARWLLRFVPDLAPPTPAELRTVTTRLEALLGNGLSLEPTDLLLPESSGKFCLSYPARKAWTTMRKD